MTFFKFDNIKIAGIASAVPSTVVKSTDYVDKFGNEAVQKFVEMTGVQEHRATLKHQTASDLGYVAAEKLLMEKNVNRDSIGVLIFGAHSTDYRRPATACVLHKRLGLGDQCSAYDISLGCSAFVYCAQVAASMLACSDANKALIIVGETMTKIVYPEDKSSAMLFGDGGAAILLEKTDDNNELSGELCTDGKGYRAIIAPAGGFRNFDDTKEPMIWEDGNPRTLYNTYMNGMDVFSFTVTKVPRTIKNYLKRTGQEIGQFDCLAFHQANRYIQQQLAKKLKADITKMPLCLDRYGNTSAPAIPLLLSDVYGKDDSAKDLKILMCGFGVGLSWGVLSAVINSADIFPIVETDEYFTEGLIHSPEDLKK
ncbi:MAG: ketoacyl-ACP synthase III [Acidaminococcaceae bacterium]|nr:ketoacyl-ACP synthase III [Acidaminococcaceae bacterium]